MRRSYSVLRIHTGELAYLNGREYHEIAARVFEKDMRIAYSLAMFDYVCDQAKKPDKGTLEGVASYHLAAEVNNVSGGLRGLAIPCD